MFRVTGLRVRVLGWMAENLRHLGCPSVATNPDPWLRNPLPLMGIIIGILVKPKGSINQGSTLSLSVPCLALPKFPPPVVGLGRMDSCPDF